MKHLVFILTLIPTIAQAGIINTLPPIPKETLGYERTNDVKDEIKINARLNAAITWEQGNTNKLDLAAGGLISVGNEELHLHFVSTFVRNTSSGALEDFNTLNHLRGRWWLAPWFGLEAFTQHEFDPFRKLDTRYLLGAGPVFRLVSIKQLHVAFGTSGMFEYIMPSESQIPQETNPRWSNYLQIEVVFTDALTATNTTFFQMNFTNSRDIMLFNASYMEVKATDWFGVSLGFVVSHDEMPLVGVQKTDVSVNSSLFVELK